MGSDTESDEFDDVDVSRLPPQLQQTFAKRRADRLAELAEIKKEKSEEKTLPDTQGTSKDLQAKKNKAEEAERKVEELAAEVTDLRR